MADKKTNSSDEIMGVLQQIISQFQAGGSYGKGSEAVLDRSKARSVSSANQSAVSSGLSGTSVPAGFDKKWEEEIGAPQRLQIEDSRTQLLSQAMMAKAGFMERLNQQEAEKEMQDKQMAMNYRTSRSSSPSSSMSSMFDKSPSKAQSSKAIQHIGANRVKAPVFGTSSSGSSWSTVANSSNNRTKSQSAPMARFKSTPASVTGYNRYKSQTSDKGITQATPDEFAEINRRLKAQYGVSPSGAYY